MKLPRWLRTPERPAHKYATFAVVWTIGCWVVVPLAQLYSLRGYEPGNPRRWMEEYYQGAGGLHAPLFYWILGMSMFLVGFIVELTIAARSRSNPDPNDREPHQ